MPEGDSILWAATRLRRVIDGVVPDSILFPHPRFGRDRYEERLAGRRIERLQTRGKNLFIVFEGDLVLHSHLRMSGSWVVRQLDTRSKRPDRRAWVKIRRGEREVVEFDGPVLELLTASRVRFDPRFTRLGPDVLAPDRFDEETFLARLRAGEDDRSIGDALLDQRVVCGIGNIWKSEGCWEAELDPWRRVSTVSDDAARTIIAGIRPRMLVSGLEGREQVLMYGLAGRPCPRCGTKIQARRLGDGARITYWCPGCQH